MGAWQKPRFPSGPELDTTLVNPVTSWGMDMGSWVTRPSLRSNVEVLAKVRADVDRLPRGPKREMALRVVGAIGERIVQREDYRRYVAFPPMYVRLLDDGELLLEWPFRLGRVHFSIEEQPGESEVMFLDGSKEGVLPMVVSKRLDSQTVDVLSFVAVDFVAGRI